MAYLLGWKDVLRPIRDGYRHLFPPPDTGPTPEEREKQRQLDSVKGFTYFDTFAQLEAWTEADSDPVQRANTPLLARSSVVSEKGVQKADVLLCHDFSGNYHEYEAVSSIGLNEEVYSCEYLQYVDSFIYFSHKLVCVPPPSWTNTLHRNGVKSLGTLLIEPQTNDSEKLLHHSRSMNDRLGRVDLVFPFAQKLSDIARHNGFDGWLINIEKPFPEGQWDPLTLESFLRYLKGAMGTAGELIWYDALTTENKIAYQNALTTKNTSFAAACGAVLTNYCWNEGEARSSKDLAVEHNLSIQKIYFGIDVWAQNKTTLTHPRITYPEKGGGGTNTGVGVSKLAELGLSVGIFAPAWSFEHFPGFGRSIERTMWNGRVLPSGAVCSCGNTSTRHPPNREYPITGSATQYPAGSKSFFYTDFSRAFAQHTIQEARRIYNGKALHSQLGSQSILPLASSAGVIDDQSAAPDILTHRLSLGQNKTCLLVEVEPIDLSKAVIDSTYERPLPLFRLDMPADGSLQLTISCCYSLPVPGAVTSVYLKTTSGMKLIPLVEHRELQTVDYVINPIDQFDRHERLQELGVRLCAPAFTETKQILEINEIRIIPCLVLKTTSHYRICDVSLKSFGEGDTEHWRLRWGYCEGGEATSMIPGVSHSETTGPFSYFAIRFNGMELGRAYAMEHVLPKSLMAGFVGKGVEVVLTGVGFDGRKLASKLQTCHFIPSPSTFFHFPIQRLSRPHRVQNQAVRLRAAMMNLFRLLGDLSHLLSILILLQKMKTSSSASGISFKSQFLYLIVYVTRYVDLLWTFYEPKSLYNTIFKIIFISSASYTVYLMLNDYKPTHDPNLDTFKVQYLIGASAILAILFPYKYNFTEILWAFSIWLESVAILPQLFMLQRTGEAETITTHYLFALGAYRALYIPNWIYRYFFEVPRFFDPIAVIAGIVQTILYSDFFWIYYTKVIQGKKFNLPV
ncbi:hypothetical protein N0V90_012349 [Kalmusia sp. IMI 367209]|nr:hypothetical protein N0V90_012349 [Kalmusia sp. IMI 367209]